MADTKSYFLYGVEGGITLQSQIFIQQITAVNALGRLVVTQENIEPGLT